MENQNEDRLNAMERQMQEMMTVMQTLVAQNQTLLQQVNAAPPAAVPPPEVLPPNGAHNGGALEHVDGGNNEVPVGAGVAAGVVGIQPAHGMGIVGENESPGRFPEEHRRRENTVIAEVPVVGIRPEASRIEGASVKDATANQWEEQFRAMQAQMQGVLAAVRVPNTMEDLLGNAASPFAPTVMACPLPSKFKMPTLDSFDGSQDPLDHLETFKTLMNIHAYPDEIMCRVFPATLKGPARLWISKVKAGSITNFSQLSKLFVGHFIGGQRQRRPATHLLTIRQGRDESLRDYVGRFNKEILEVDEADEKVVMTAFMSGLTSPRFMASLVKKPPTDLAELMLRAQKYINVDDAMKARRDAAGAGSSKLEKKRSGGPNTVQDERDTKNRRFDRRPDRGPERFDDRDFTPLNTRLENVFFEIQHDPALKWPAKLKTPADKRYRGKYCRFHRDHGHDTDECFDLKQQVETLIRRGRLGRFVAGRENRRRDRRSPDRRSPRRRSPRRENFEPQRQDQDPIGEIRVIAGGFASGGESSTGRKKYAREATRPKEVLTADRPSKKTKTVAQPISFTEEEASEICQPHDDPLVISAVIANFKIWRILVDSGSSADILYWEAFEKMNVGREKLCPVSSPLVGFTGDRVTPLGSITLPVTLGERPHQATQMINFLVVDCPSVYNVIVGRTALNRFRAVASTYHLRVKFPTEDGVGCAKGNQKMARECYMSSLKDASPKEALVIDGLEVRDEEEIKRGQPGGEMEDLIVDSLDLERKIKVGADTPEPIKSQIKEFLSNNIDVFAWSHEDMPGINTNVVAHHLNIFPTARPIKQKRRVFCPERNQAIAQEVDKLLKAEFIREVHYPAWLSNVVLVKKSNGKWRMCVDFTDLNKACPKDSFPLPSIDLLVDSTAGHELLSFMDAFSGYNQIKMAEQDQEHTAFITDRGLYCYNVMPFGLKNAGATYQRLMNRMFKGQSGRNVEVYVDDMLVKSRRADSHVADLQETFNTLRKYGMKLNPAKCAFGVRSGKFLGFMVSRRGIEANPEKITAIMEMQPPRTIKEVQKLAGRVAALNRFVSRSTDKCHPFFKVLRTAFEWTAECDEAFQQLKQYLGSVPLLSRTIPGEELYLYLTVSATAVSSALVREEKGSQKPVYYTSKALRGAEERYPKMELLALALVTATRRLRAYFQAHTVVVLTDQPLKNILHKPETSGRLMKWSVELSQFDIQYRPRIAIKGQAVADFIAEFTSHPDIPPEEDNLDQLWTLHVDGSSTQNSSGAGVLLITPDGHKFQYALRFTFPASNNVAEYEAIIAGLRMARRMGADQIRVFSDSQLVVEQVHGEYEARGEHMAEYCERARSLSRRFAKFQLQRIPRQQNEEADRLAKIASSGVEALDIPIEILDSPSIQTPEINHLESDVEWAKPIRAYLELGTLPENKNEARKIQLRASKYLVINDILYRRGHSSPLLRCLDEREADYVMREIHEGVCGNHSGGRALAGKVLRAGYYWPTLEADTKEFVKKCDKCQRFSNIPRQPAQELTPIQSPWPFVQWGIDIVGPLPLGKGQRKFAVVAIDYFTKWAEAEALPSITEQNMRKFLWQSIVCRFGIPKVVITDNGKQFEGRQFNGLCEELGISHHYSSPEHPQANGQVEVTNRSLLKIIKTKLDRAKGLWADELPNILWAYRTTQRTPTGFTPFSLTYGTEAMIPVEIGLPSPRALNFNPDQNKDSLTEETDLLEEKRLQAAIRMASYQQRMRQYHNSRARPREFAVGDLVLKRVNQSTRNPQEGKLGPNWEGPYEVMSYTRKGTYQLKILGGKELPHPWRAEHLRRYYT